jgi:hypothetical protein
VDGNSGDVDGVTLGDGTQFLLQAGSITVPAGLEPGSPGAAVAAVADLETDDEQQDHGNEDE